MHGADRAFHFWQVLMLHHSLKAWDFYWSKWYAQVTAGGTASNCNECFSKDRGDDEKYRGPLGYYTCLGSMAGYQLMSAMDVCCDYVGERIAIMSLHHIVNNSSVNVQLVQPLLRLERFFSVHLLKNVSWLTSVSLITVLCIVSGQVLCPLT